MVVTMKKLTILLFSILISFSSYGEWFKIGEITNGDVYYIDQDSIKQQNGYVYFWAMGDYFVPNKYGDMSGKAHYQGECSVNRFKHLSYIFYKQQMGSGAGETGNAPGEWKYLSPEGIGSTMLNYVCDYVD